jgi:Na+-transporting NADH:ubiquinone oxidoreductase subunit B
MSRAFLYFAYPQQIAGEVWIAAKTNPDVYSGATWLQQAKDYGMSGLLPSGEETVRGGVTWMQAFLGFEAGSMGETSALLIGFGAILLIASGVGSWRIMLSMFLSCTVAALFFNVLYWTADLGGDGWGVPFWWHWVIGGFMFAMVYMATDPVSASFTNKGKYFYGAGIGILGMLIRVMNPAFPGSWMLAILFMNMFSPLIDYFVVQANIRRRSVRYAT